MRKPQPLGIELNTAASKGTNGPMIWAEVQEGKIGMRHKKYVTIYGACDLRLAKGRTYYSELTLWRQLVCFIEAAVALYQKVGAEFVGPIKTAHSKFPKGLP